MAKTKSQAMTRTQIYIEPDTLLQAKIIAKSRGLNLSQHLRDLLKEYNKNSQNSIPSQKIIPIRVTKLKDKKTVYISRDHNDIYD